MRRLHLRLLLLRTRPLRIQGPVTTMSAVTTILTAAAITGVKAIMLVRRSMEPRGSVRATTVAATILDIGDAGVNSAELLT